MIKNQHRKFGKFAKRPTLKNQGYPISEGKTTCAKCGHVWLPILTTAPCPKCKEYSA